VGRISSSPTTMRAKSAIGARKHRYFGVAIL
jgi:hypothetical protein